MHSTQFFTDKQLEALQVKLQTIEGRTNNLLSKCTLQSFANQKAQEFARQGFGRRIQTLRRCIHRVLGWLNVELSLPIFRLALAVFIPWRGADGFDRRSGWHPR